MDEISGRTMGRCVLGLFDRCVEMPLLCGLQISEFE